MRNLLGKSGKCIEVMVKVMSVLKILLTFPPSWGRRRVDEARIAAYTGVIGFLFMTFPKTLAYPVYVRIGNTDNAWIIGLTMMLVSAGHVSAMYLNGKAIRTSRIIRGIACILHMLIVGTFASIFAMAGDLWGVFSAALIITLIYSAMCRVFRPWEL